MRGVVWLVLLFAVAVVAATTFGANDGLVTVYWRGWRTDLSLNLFLIAMVGGCLLLISAVNAVNALIGLPQRARAWRALGRERAAQAALREALSEYLGARYSRAHKAALRARAIQDDSPHLRGDVEFSMLAQLLAARSLHRLQDRPQRDEALQQALKLVRQPGGPRSAAAEGTRMLAAEFALDDRDASRALELLAELPPGVARRTTALRLKLKALRLSRQPLEALHTARMLANHQAFSETAARGLLRSLACEALERTHDADQLRRVWLQLDPSDRRDPVVAARAAQRSAALGSPDDGRGWLRPFWDELADLDAADREQVALALTEVLPGLGVEWLPRLESGIGLFPQEPAVVAAVGLAFAERGLWGKARRPLEQAAAAETLAPRARRRAWRALAEIARLETDDSRARDCERAAAEIG